MQSSLVLGAPPPLASLLKSGAVALFLDFDGTLVELAKGPDAINPLPDLGLRLQALSKRLGDSVAIVSGRAIEDIERHIGPLSIAAAGSHGLDIRGVDGRASGGGPDSLPRVIEDQLRAFAAQEGADFERKPHGGALHYRSNPALGAKVHAFAENLAAEYGWAVQRGKCVAELVAKGASKGGAVKTLMGADPFANTRPIFIGDDLTDEAGFLACQELGGAGILVNDGFAGGELAGAGRESCAQYHLPSVSAVHSWLEL